MKELKDNVDRYYDFYEDIGSGQFAIVKRCKKRATNEEFAAKIIKKKRNSVSRRGLTMADIQREIDILFHLDHPNVVKLHEVYDCNTEVCLILELVSGGDLFDFIAKTKLTEKEALTFTRQILLGVKHMHDKGIAHLDLKPENVMLSSRDSKCVKLIDFGLSRELNNNKENFKEMCGTAEFVAPEIVNYDPISLATDMWSIGVIAYMLLSEASPFLGENELDTFANITAVQYEFDEELFSHTSQQSKDFISALLIKNPRKRLTVDECLSHPWLQQRMPVELNVVGIKNEPGSVDNPTLKKLWKHSILVIMQCNRLIKSNKLNSSSCVPNVSKTPESPSKEQNENFVVEALFTAIEEGNLGGLEELFSMSNINANQCNKHGETAVHIAAGLGQLDILIFLHSKGADIHRLDSHGDSAIYWAARQGHDPVIRYLFDQEVSVTVQNKSKETALHIASRYGHTTAVTLLCSYGSEVNKPDEHGEAALHIAVWHGFPKIVNVLCQYGADTNIENKEGETPLHCAAARGHIESIKCLLEASSNLNILDKNGSTGLHLALRRHHTSVALLLLQAGAKMDVIDKHGDAPIHIVAKDGLLPLVHSLCSFGCKLDVPNKMGLYPLYIAAKNGHIEVVRYLCLAGCKVDQKNRDGISAEITAHAHGHSEIGELLNKLKCEEMKENYILQLVPQSGPPNRIKLKFLGHSGVGKTTLLDSLKCGYFSSWFRRSKSPSNSSVSHYGSKTNTGTHSSKSSIDMSSEDGISLSFDTNFHNYTRGIDIQQVNLSGVGEVGIWEFSGHEPYYLVYDHFLRDTSCIYIIVFSANDPFEVQLQQVSFWLAFLQARLHCVEPLGRLGRSQKPGHVVLVATHADIANCSKGPLGEFVSEDADKILKEAKARFQHNLQLHDTVYILDAHVVGSQAVKSLKQYFTTAKHKVMQDVPKSSGFLDLVLIQLAIWRKNSNNFPVIPYGQFVEMVHNQVNPLAGVQHLDQLVVQLQLMGEIMYLKSDNQDLVVLNPKWLCMDVLGQILSFDHLEHTKMSGTYSVDDIQLLFPDNDALDLLQVLEALQLCTQCEGDIEYEFPCFNLTERSDNMWQCEDMIYGGVRVFCGPPEFQLLRCIFPRLQAILRKWALDRPSTELVQYRHCSKLNQCLLEAVLTFSNGVLDIMVRGPETAGADCFYLSCELLSLVDQCLHEICPSLLHEKQPLSPSELKQHLPMPKAFPSILGILHKNGQKNESDRELNELLVYGCPGILQDNPNVVLGTQLHVSHLPLPLLQHLSTLLDPVEPIGRDWCMLAVLLGMMDILPHLDPGDNPSLSPMQCVLQEWAKEPQHTVGCLLDKLTDLGRQDAVDLLYKHAPWLKIFPPEDEAATTSSATEVGGIGGSHTSSSNLSR